MATAGISFMRSWYAQEYGILFGSDYFLDPLRRVPVDQRIDQVLRHRFPDLPITEQSVFSTFLGVQAPRLRVRFAPVHVLQVALGGSLHLSEDQDPWVEGESLDIAAFCDMGMSALADYPLVRQMLEQYATLEAAYPGEPIYFGGIREIAEAQSVLTASASLFGTALFEAMLLTPALAFRAMDRVSKLLCELVDLFAARRGDRATAIHLGDCSATMLSPAQYRTFGVHYNSALSRKYGACEIHSCGACSHLIAEFARVWNVRWLELGWGTDMTRARDMFPRTQLIARLSPVLLREWTPEQVRAQVHSYVAAAGSGPLHIAVVGVEAGTPDANIYALFEAANGS